ncbi:MAG: hypothetical protein AAFR31_11400 [Cyanobacteria bacterium J06627_8]
MLVILAYGGVILPASAQDADAVEAAEATSQIMKVRLGVSGPDNEWVRFEMDSGETGDIILRAYHTTRVRRTFLSELTTGLLSFGAEELVSGITDGDYEGPVPIPGINFHRWDDHETLSLSFNPDQCPDTISTCPIQGTTSIVLPEGTDIREGSFTIEYAEEDLIRTITFRMPTEEAEDS